MSTVGSDLKELIPLHRQYVEIVRAVAEEEGVLLCDLAAAFDAMRPDERRNHFRRDGIHLRQWGDEKIAALLVECFGSSEEVQKTWVPRPS